MEIKHSKEMFNENLKQKHFLLDLHHQNFYFRRI